MPTHVYFQIPIATDPVRVLIGGFCVLCVAAIFGSWLPRVVRWLTRLRRENGAQPTALVAVAIVPIVIGLVPLTILIVLIRNPLTIVSNTGVTKENLFSKTTTSFTWRQIAQVTCRTGRGAGPRWFTLTSTDGHVMGVGNPGGFDFVSLRLLLENRLGPAVMQGCPRRA